MAIKVKTSKQEAEEASKIKVKIEKPDLRVKLEHEDPLITFELNARKVIMET